MNNVTEGITELINAIRSLTGVGICYYDLNSFFQYDKYGAKNNRGHYCAFCEMTRALPGGRQYCDQSDRIEAVALAKEYRGPFFHKCHMGMRELVIPLFNDNDLLGILFVGQCRTDNDNKDEVKESALKMNADPHEFLELYNNLPVVSKKDMLSIGTILLQYFDTKILSRELLDSTNFSSKQSIDLVHGIRGYIKQNYRFSISPKQIAKEFFVNPSYASRCFSERYGITITDYISKVRIDMAKSLLITTNVPIGNISLNIGYEDANYFSRVFKRIVGESPSEYRQKNQKRQ